MFFIRAAAKIPFFCNSTMALRMQNPLSRMNTLPLPQTGSVNLSKALTVFPRSSNCLLLSCGGRSLPSRNSRDQMMLESAQPALWYSLPNGQGFRGTNINPGQVYSFSDLLIDSSIQLIQLGMKFVAMFLFHSSSISCTSQNLSLYVGGSSFVYFICCRINSNLVRDMYCERVKKHPLKIFMSCDTIPTKNGRELVEI